MASVSIVSAVARSLEGKVALITGGASGIGECTVKLFSKHGAKVAIAGILDELGHSVIKTIGPSNSTYIHCDVTIEDHIKNAGKLHKWVPNYVTCIKLVDQTVSTYERLDIMFNNAGIIDNPKPLIMDNEKTDFERIFLGMKHEARVMVPARSGTHAYTCSKHAIVGLTRNLAVELGQFGIRVNFLSPYGLATNLATKYLGIDEEELEEIANSMANLKGITHKVDDVVNAALFLRVISLKYVSGQNLFIDGGYSISNSAVKLFRYPES